MSFWRYPSPNMPRLPVNPQTRIILRSMPGGICRRHHTTNPDVLRPFTRHSLEHLKRFFQSPLSPSVSWHPASDCRVPPVTTNTGTSNHDAPPDQTTVPSGPYAYDPSHPRHAAVLVALANVAVPSALRSEGERVQPSILLEVRSSNMRSHGGEVRQVPSRSPLSV